MSWVTARAMLITLAVITALFLFGIMGNIFGFDLGTTFFGTGITVKLLLGISQGYIAWSLWQRYL